MRGGLLGYVTSCPVCVLKWERATRENEKKREGRPDLHVGDVVSVPEWHEEPVGEAHHQLRTDGTGRYTTHYIASCTQGHGVVHHTRHHQLRSGQQGGTPHKTPPAAYRAMGWYTS